MVESSNQGSDVHHGVVSIALRSDVQRGFFLVRTITAGVGCVAGTMAVVTNDGTGFKTDYAIKIGTTCGTIW